MEHQDEKKIQTYYKSSLEAKENLENEIKSAVAEFERLWFHKVTKIKLKKDGTLMLRVELLGGNSKTNIVKDKPKD